MRKPEAFPESRSGFDVTPETVPLTRGSSCGLSQLTTAPEVRANSAGVVVVLHASIVFLHHLGW